MKICFNYIKSIKFQYLSVYLPSDNDTIYKYYNIQFQYHFVNHCSTRKKVHESLEYIQLQRKELCVLPFYVSSKYLKVYNNLAELVQLSCI